MSNPTVRRGRPPKVHDNGTGVLGVSVKGQEYRFKKDAKGALRPVNPQAGVSEDRAYAKAQVQRFLAES